MDYVTLNGTVYQGSGAFIVGPDKVSVGGGGYNSPALKTASSPVFERMTRFWTVPLWKEVA